MFIDIAKIKIVSGKGGDGKVGFHREKYVAAGGPDGGDGGRGGSVIFKVDDNLSTLLDFRYKKKYVAAPGEPGGGKRCKGKDGADLVIRVPRGTIIRDQKTGQVMKDMSDNEPYVAAKGGNGGWGNTHFATPTRQAPRFAKPGLPGVERDIVLELKLLADVGLVGFPNVGKSTFINRILGRRSAKAADRPGVTRGSQWFRVDSGIDLLDTPGILWPKFDDERVGILLACTGAIKDDILDVETLGCKLMELLAEQAPQTIIDRYSIAIPEEECDFLGYELLQQAGKRRGFLLRGGEIDTERMARILLDEFRGGVLGRITLEMPAAAE